MAADPTQDPLLGRAMATPDREAVVDTNTGCRVSYRTLNEQVDSLAAHLLATDITTTDRVGILMTDRYQVVRSVHALFRTGATAVPMDPQAPSAALQDLIDRANVTMILHDEATAETADIIVDAATKITSVDVSAQPTAKTPETGSPVSWDPGREAVVMFTSGTTGTPNGVRLTGGNLHASAEASAYRLGITQNDGWLDCLPLHHMGGFAPIVRTVYYGTTLYLQQTFDTETTASVLQTHDITGVSLVPTMLDRLLSTEWTPPEQLRTVLLGGAPASTELLTQARQQSVPVYLTYGMTETASQVATATPEQSITHEDTVGQPLIGMTVTIVADGSPVEAGTQGEIVVSGPAVTPGYLSSDKTETTMSQYGLHTGDRGYQDTNGYLWITGRVDDRIITGGETVDPTAVADVLREHPAVAEAAVVGIPDPIWGQQVCAAIVLTEDIDATTLEAHCRERLAAYKCPKEYQHLTTLPRTASGTIDRARVREQFTE